ncbi:MAG: hypothetical protein WCP87_01900 [Atribacterota bacterium]
MKPGIPFYVVFSTPTKENPVLYRSLLPVEFDQGGVFMILGMSDTGSRFP